MRFTGNPRGSSAIALRDRYLTRGTSPMQPTPGPEENTVYRGHYVAGWAYRATPIAQGTFIGRDLP